MRRAEALISHLPLVVRPWLKRARDRAQRLESRLRARLPQALGGRFDDASAECRCLTPADAEAFDNLRPRSGAGATTTSMLTASNARFFMSVFVRGRLVGVGHCLLAGAGSSLPAGHALFAADFIDPAFRRRGLARRLHAARLAELARRGVSTAVAWVNPQNHAALACLAGGGFVRASNARSVAESFRPGPEWILVVADVDAVLRAAGSE